LYTAVILTRQATDCILLAIY